MDIIGRSLRSGASAAAGSATAADIMAMLARRPCTADDLARGLGLHINEALKHLEAPATANRLQRVVKNKEFFYTSSLAKAPP